MIGCIIMTRTLIWQESVENYFRLDERLASRPLPHPLQRPSKALDGSAPHMRNLLGWLRLGWLKIA